jgi:PAS domain S-box-containing protein
MNQSITYSNSENTFLDLLENVNLIAVLLDINGRVTYYNPYLQKLTGYNEEELSGSDWFQKMVPDNWPEIKKVFLDGLNNGDIAKYLENPIVTKSGELRYIRWSNTIMYNASGSVTGTSSIGEDITDRKNAEEKLLKINRLSSVISQINNACIHIRETDKLFREVCRIAVDTGNFRMAWVGLIDDETKCVKPAAFYGIEDGYLSRIRIVIEEDLPEGQGPTAKAIREGKHIVSNDIETDHRMAPWRDKALKRGYRSSIGLPLKVYGKVAGVFNLYSSVPQFFAPEEVDLLVEVSANISFALESIETDRKRQVHLKWFGFGRWYRLN